MRFPVLHPSLSHASRWTLRLLATCFALCCAALTAHAQAYTWRNVEIVGGGYVPAVIFNESEPNLIYARTDIGGAYRWNPTTQRWIPLLDWIGFDDWNLTGVDALATDPVDPSRLYILAGTYTNSWTSQNGAILRSTDRGATFQRTNLPFKSGGNMPGRNMGERLAIDPNRNSVLYLGARSGNGLWRSTDFGVTWSRVTSFPATGTYAQDPSEPNYLYDPIGVTWITFDKTSGTAGTATPVIYVGVADLGTSIYRSTDGGATWAAVPGQPTGFLPHHGVLASTGFLYVTYSNKGGPYDGEKGDVWKLQTSTGTWTRISPVPSTSTDNYYGYGGLAVDKQNPNTLMVASLNSWWPDAIIFRSTDAGATWTRAWDWASYPNRTFRYTQDISASPWLVFTDTAPVPPVSSPRLGWMIGDIKIDPFNSNRMMYGTGATIYGTENLTTWDAGGQIALTVKAQGIEETAVHDLISPPSGAPLLSGLADINGFRHDSLTVPPARMFNTPSFGTQSLDFAELSPTFIARVGSTSTAGVTRAGFSFDGGTSWFQASSEPGGVTGGGTIAAAANASRVVWSPEGAAPHYSTNNGSAWTASAGLPSGARVAADRVNPLKFYGFANGTFYVSTNGGANFTASGASGLPAYARFKAVPGREGDIWLAGGSETTVYGLWHSIDGGATFTKVAAIEEADNVGFGKAAAGQTYPAIYTSAQIGGVRGLYRSIDAGATWQRINDDQHQFAHTGGAITGDPRVFGRVFIATNGRGIIWGEPANANSLTASPTALSFAAAASSGTVAISSNVAWTASATPTWLSLSVASGSNNASLVVSATANIATTARSGTVTVTGGGITQTVTVTQAGASANSLTASPTSLSLAAAASSGTVAITSNVSWTITDNQTWLSVTPATGSNNATVTVSATANTATTARSGTVTVTGGGISRTVTVTQAGASTNSLTVSPTSLSLAATASSGTFAITSNVSWTITDNQTWLSVTPASGSNNATVTVSATANTATTARSGTVTVTGGGLTQTVAVSQAGAGSTPCSNPTPITLPFTKDGAGEFCYVTSGTINYVNSWNLQLLEINGVNYTNRWSNSMPARIDGKYFIRYVGQYAWSHLEITGSP
jgi:xyloglucan-specific exo-beta-1,4-glucanase